MDEPTAIARRWDLARLSQPPEFETVETEIAVHALHYRGEPYQGKPTRVFAYMAVPPPPRDEASAPGMVLVHGGGGTAFRDWVSLWSARGYAAIAMDLGGCTAGRQRLPDGGPPQEHADKFRDPSIDWPDHWVYHAAANVILAHSLLRAQPGVDPNRIGLTGISWGGFVTGVVAGLDRRFRYAVPVYGCGFIHLGSSWSAFFERMAPDARERWVAWCDPSSYLPQATAPMLFINGTNDAHYWLPQYKRSYSVVPSPVTISIRLAMLHNHPAGWAPPEIGWFADHFCRGAPALPRLETPVWDGLTIRAAFTSARPAAAARLVGTHDRGHWPHRKWRELPAVLEGQTVVARVPEGASACYLAITDERGAYVSSPHIEIDSQ